MSNNAINVDNFINTLNRRYPNINSNVQFFLDIIQNEFGGSQQDALPSDNNNVSIEQFSELFRNTLELRSPPSSAGQGTAAGSTNFNRHNSHRYRDIDSANMDEFSDALGFDSNAGVGENRRNSRTNSFVEESNNIPINPASNIVNSLDDQIRRNQNSIRDMIEDYNENMIQYNRNMDRLIMSYNNNIHQYQRNTAPIIGVLQEFQTHIIHPPSRTSFVNPPRANTRTGNRYTTRNNNNPINWTAFIPLRYNSTRYLDNRLTQAQIDTSTQTIEYNADMDEERCPISWEDFVVGEQICQIKECEHIFKSTSLLNWLRTNSHCPVCRYDLRTYNGTTPGRVSRTTSNRSNRTRPNSSGDRRSPTELVVGGVNAPLPEQVSDIDVSLNTVDMDTQHANENPYIDNNDEIETIYTTSIDLDINSINNLDAILESVMQQIGDDIIRSYDASNNDI